MIGIAPHENAGLFICARRTATVARMPDRPERRRACMTSPVPIRVLLVAITQNGLNLLGVSPYAFKMVIGLTILVAISLSNFDLSALAAGQAGRRRLGRLD